MEIRKEAIWAVSNMLSSASPRQVAMVVELDVIEAMSEALNLTDSGLILVALDAIKQVLRTGKEQGKPYDVYFDECDGVSKLENLQHHSNTKIYERAVELIDDFYGGGEEDLEDENLAPAQSGGFYQFGFGSPTSKNLFGAAHQSPNDKFNFGSPMAAQSSNFNFGFTDSSNKHS
jgi:hypothetical protein